MTRERVPKVLSHFFSSFKQISNHFKQGGCNIDTTIGLNLINLSYEKPLKPGRQRFYKAYLSKNNIFEMVEVSDDHLMHKD